MKQIVRVVAIPCAAAAALVLATGGTAGAHVSPDKESVPAGSFNNVTLSVGHGCDGSPTLSLAIEVPEQLLDVTPELRPDWDVEVTTEELDEPVEIEGEEVTERESVVTYTAKRGNELPDGFRTTFNIGFRTPETPGEWMFFKTVQTCEEGEHRWVEEYTGEGEEPDEPAPAVLITEPEEEEAPDAAADQAEDEGAATDESAAADDDDDGDSSTGIAVAGLVVGALGLIAGGAALVRTRKPAAS